MHNVKPNNFSRACQDKANELLLSYQGEYTTAGVMLLVNEAVRAGAELGLDMVDRLLVSPAEVNSAARKVTA
jgi:hypothetical protein